MESASKAPVEEEVAARLSKSPSVATLLDISSSSHRALREALGPHHLHYTAHFELKPVQPLGRPAKVGERIETDLQVDDELELVWAAPDDAGLHFSLRQQNNHDDRRELVVDGETAYTRLWEAPWYERELDGQLHEQWLDDAIHAVHDMLEFAAPGLALGLPEEVELGGRKAYAFALSRSAETEVELGRGGDASLWRAGAKLETVEGRVVFDAATGAAIDAKIELSFTMRDAAGRDMRGQSRLEAKLEMGPQSIVVPESAGPLPTRERYEIERKKLLDGLAAL